DATDTTDATNATDSANSADATYTTDATSKTPRPPAPLTRIAGLPAHLLRPLVGVDGTHRAPLQEGDPAAARRGELRPWRARRRGGHGRRHRFPVVLHRHGGGPAGVRRAQPA